jgi:hypothetical protein
VVLFRIASNDGVTEHSCITEAVALYYCMAIFIAAIFKRGYSIKTTKCMKKILLTLVIQSFIFGVLIARDNAESAKKMAEPSNIGQKKTLKQPSVDDICLGYNHYTDLLLKNILNDTGAASFQAIQSYVNGVKKVSVFSSDLRKIVLPKSTTASFSEDSLFNELSGKYYWEKGQQFSAELTLKNDSTFELFYLEDLGYWYYKGEWRIKPVFLMEPQMIVLQAKEMHVPWSKTDSSNVKIELLYLKAKNERLLFELSDNPRTFKMYIKE